MEQLNVSDVARKSVKADLGVANEKIIVIEEELYESKTV